MSKKLLLNGDDGDPTLPVFCRFSDLHDAGIVGSWMALTRLIDAENFPPGVLLSKNIRAWDVGEVRRWLATRPTARKVIAAKKPGRHEQQDTTTAEA
jgi:hypothetical protein